MLPVESIPCCPYALPSSLRFTLSLGNASHCYRDSRKKVLREAASAFPAIRWVGVGLASPCSNEWLPGCNDADGSGRLLLPGIWSSEQKQKRLSDLCTWGIGGPCCHFLEVRRPPELASAVRYFHEISMPFIIVGKGSNCLFDDRGFEGCVVLNRISTIERASPGLYRVGSGYPFNGLGTLCSGEGYSGLEFAAGVPGTVGGAAFMNASANGQETADCIANVEILTRNGETRVIGGEDLNFGYRRSIFHEMDDLAAILAVTFLLTPSATAKKQQQGYLDRRRRTQPVNERSAGSVFLNPSDSDLSAGELIERAGLKGARIGGAKVSEIHANFFINTGNSTSRDMLTLISHVKEKVEKSFGVLLKEEIRYIPYNVD